MYVPLSPYLVANVNYGAVNQTIGDVDLQIEGCFGPGFTGTFTITTDNAGTLSGTTSGSDETITQTPAGPMCPTPASCQPPYVQFTFTQTVTAGTGLFARNDGGLAGHPHFAHGPRLRRTFPSLRPLRLRNPKATTGVTKLVYEVSGGPSDLSDVQVATATAAIYG